MTPEIEQILKNQLAIMEAIKSIDWRVQTGGDIFQNGDVDTWEHSINGPIKETEKLLRGY
jgi:hypothetical protein